MVLSQEDAEKLKRLGKNIQTERRRTGLTQQKLADAVGVQVRTIHKFERGKINIPTLTLLRIRAALGSDWKNLLGK
jgi:transcriptional regulator with XRE-family HTH domain